MMADRLKPRVLVVDDSPTIRRVVSTVLRKAGYEVATAEDGETGLVEAGATDPDLILLDFMMPGMTGVQVVESLARADRRAPIVLMCTRTDQLPEEPMIGVVDSITKPFSPDAIVAVVAHRLARINDAPIIGQLEAEPGQAAAELPDDIEPTQPGMPALWTKGAFGRLGFGAADGSALDDDAPHKQSASAIDDALRHISRLLGEALNARRVDEASDIAAAVCADLRGHLAPGALAIANPSRASTSPPSILSGSIEAVGLPEVLQLLKFQGQTGVMEVVLPRQLPGGQPSRFEVAVKNGLIIAVRAHEVRSDLLLGNYFVGAGLISRAQLDSVLNSAAAQGTSAPLGRRLVEAGLVTTEQLRRCVTAQAQDLMVELLRARNGTFSLRTGAALLPTTQIVPGISVDMLLFESLRRIDEWRVIETRIPSFDSAFITHSADIHDLSPDEIEVLCVFKEGRPVRVRDLLRTSSLRAFDACKIVYRLCLAQRLRRVDDGQLNHLFDGLDDVAASQPRQASR